MSKESLSASLNTLDLSIKVRELIILFIDKIRQANKSNQIASGRVNNLVKELLDILGRYGEHNLITALQKTLAKEDFSWRSRNVTGYVRTIAKNLFEQNKQGQIERQSKAEKETLEKAESSKLYQDIERELRS